MQNFVELGKLEGAKRHLDVAIRMFFERKDPIVVYTVAWSAYQVLSEICKLRGISRQIEDNPILDELGIKKEFLTAFREPRNFFQHADRDPDGTVKFFPDMAYVLPLTASELYEKLVPGQFWSGRVLQMWFFLKHPDHTPKIVQARIDELPHKPDSNDYELFLELISRMGG